jgi:predicted negative regulator of RcsB-dependent stress response
VSDEQPKDRNARVREDAARKGLLKKRDDQAQKAIPLAPGELVDDAVARGTDAALKWIGNNASIIGYVVLGAIAGGVGWYVYDARATRRAETASAMLAKAVLDEHGRVGEAPKAEEGRTDVDPTPWFKTAEEKHDAVAKAYAAVAAEHAGSGPGILAKLGEANASLDKREWEKADSAFRVVKDSPLAKADPDVRGRALEGIAYALEGKGDAEGAMKAFHDLETTDAKGFKELGQYHQARLLLAKGEKDKAKEIAKALSEKLHGPSDTKLLTNLQRDVDDLLRQIDPSAAPAKPAIGNKPMTPEDMAQLQEMIERAQKNAKGKGGP